MKTWDKFYEGVEENIRSPAKCAVVGVFDANPPFSYTVGLTDQGWPEFILPGLNPKTATGVINDAVKRLSEIGPPIEGMILDQVVRDYPVRLRPISDEQRDEYMRVAMARQVRVHGPEPRALQIVYPDAEGRWPDDPKCDPKVVFAQQLPTEEERESVQ